MKTTLRSLAFFLALAPASVWADTDEPLRIVLEPRHRTIISSEVTSTVLSIEKKMGESIKKGDLLLTLDDRIFAANERKAEAQREKARGDLAAQEQLWADKAASLAELRTARSALALAEADLVLSQKALTACRIMAPYDGKVQEVFVQEFERVEVGAKLIETIDDQVLIAKLLVPAELLSKLSIGQKLDVKIQDTNETYQAVVARIAAAIDPSSQLVKIDAEIDNSKGKLRAGLIGTVPILQGVGTSHEPTQQ